MTTATVNMHPPVTWRRYVYRGRHHRSSAPLYSRINWPPVAVAAMALSSGAALAGLTYLFS